MSFYSELCKVYDIVFPKDEEVVTFLEGQLKKQGNVLDLACGTGNYSIALGEKGHKVIGIDLDEEMIKLANKKNKNSNVTFYAIDMKNFKEINNEKYNLIFCIGNSLVHLSNTNEILDLLKNAYLKLEDKGKLIIQIINYDRILEKDIAALPTIDRKDKDVKFIRDYSYSQSKDILYFNTELIISSSGKEEIYKNSVPLLPLKSQKIIDLVKTAGFSEIKSYGSFNKEAYNKDSYVLIVEATK